MVCAVRAQDPRAHAAESELPDRVGWLAPRDDAQDGSGSRTAEVLRNRYGERAAIPLEMDETTGRLAPAPESGAL